jgi:hypothetical protein
MIQETMKMAARNRTLLSFGLIVIMAEMAEIPAAGVTERVAGTVVEEEVMVVLVVVVVVA